MDENFSDLETAIGYRFCDRALLREALTHRSYLNEAVDAQSRDNERLEFFGDAVLAFCVSLELLSHFPASREGELTKARASLVDEKSLAHLAGEIRLGEYLLLGRGERLTGGREKRSILANAFEALVAAIYLDGGLEPVQRLVRTHFVPLFHDVTSRAAGKDAKTELQERAQALAGIMPLYRLKETSGPDHARFFTVAVFLGDEELGVGCGKSKKEAEQEAAGKGLRRMDELAVRKGN